MRKWFKNLNIKQKIFYPSLFISIIISVFSSFFIVFYTQKIFEKEAIKNAETLLVTMNKLIATYSDIDGSFFQDDQKANILKGLKKSSSITKSINFIAFFGRNAALLAKVESQNYQEIKPYSLENKYKEIALSQLVDPKFNYHIENDLISASAPVYSAGILQGSMFVGISTLELNKKRKQATLFIVFGSSILLLILIIVLRKVSESISTPINNLAISAKLLENQEFDEGIKKLTSFKWGKNELGTLQNEFINMGKSLKSTLYKLDNQIELANQDLKEANDKLLEKQVIADKDMKIAANVQNNLFLKTPPELDGWQISLVFKPKSGVSGDFYDFYFDQNKLYGLSLFDVSGHGIGSALITMISKNILQRKFYYHKNEKLTQVMKHFNEELIEEIGTINNYLTGILLRIENNNIEYINAGHTDLLLKLQSTGNSYIVKPKDKEFKSLFLGIKEMQGEFKVLTFELNKGDSLLLYSDCMVEATNNSEKQYSINNLLKVFQEVPKSFSANQQLKYIMTDFEKHSNNKELDDDLTAILIKRII